MPPQTNVQHRNASDEQIVSLYVKYQSSEYFDILYNRYASKIYGKCLSMLKEETLSQDAVQEVFMKILLNVSKFSEKSRFSTWIYSITYNYCIDLIRKKKKTQQIIAQDDVESLEVVDDVEDQFILETKISRLKEILEKLSLDDKVMLLMKYQDGMSVKEMCPIVDKSESAIKMKIKRAKAKFKRIYFETYND